MLFRTAAIFTLAATSAYATIDAGAGTAAGLDIDNLVKGGLEAGGGLKVGRSIPKRHIKTRDLSNDALGALGLNNILAPLTSEVTPVLNTLTGLVSDLSKPAEDIVSSVEKELGSLTGLLGGGLSSVKGLTGNLKTVDTSNGPVSNQAAAQTLGQLTNTVAQTLQTVNGAVGSIPALGPVLEGPLKDVESSLSGILGVAGQVAQPVLSIVQGLLQPVTGILNDLGLGAVTSLLNGVL